MLSSWLAAPGLSRTAHRRPVTPLPVGTARRASWQRFIVLIIIMKLQVLVR